MIHTVLVDRAGWVIQAWHGTRSAALDARAYAHQGTLVECTGPVACGMRYVDGAFVMAPYRPDAEAIAKEAQRRIDLPFPEGFRRQVTAIGGDNALRMHTYIATVTKTAETMMASATPPGDYKNDRYWPTPPIMVDMPMPVRHVDMPQMPAQPISVHVAPVIHAGTERVREVVQETLPAVRQEAQESRVVSFPVPESAHVKRPPAVQSEPAIDIGSGQAEEWLRPLKETAVRSIGAVAEAHEGDVPEAEREAWNERLAGFAADITAATTREGILAVQERALRFISGEAA